MKPKVSVSTKITRGGEGVPKQTLSRAISKAAAATIAKGQRSHHGKSGKRK